MLAATGNKVTADDTPPVTLDSSQSGSTKDLDWPMPTNGSPMGRIWTKASRIMWATDLGEVCIAYWDRYGTSLASGDEGPLAGFPITFAGAKITYIFRASIHGLIIVTDTGQTYLIFIP